MNTMGIVLFDGAEELDFAGPFEVFTMAAEIKPRFDEARRAPASTTPWARTLLVAAEDRPVLCAKGMRVLPDATFDTAPALDVLLVPGGAGARKGVDDSRLVGYVRGAAAKAAWVTSVCTGTFLLHEAGPARGKRVTTHWSYVEGLRARGNVTVAEGPRFVRDGNLVTSAGVSAGIDMALWLVGQLESPDFARAVQRAMEYDPAPPYSAEV